MQPYQERVVEEAEQLLDKIEKLQKFIPTDTFSLLPKDEKERLHAQVAVMIDYHNILCERIKFF